MEKFRSTLNDPVTRFDVAYAVLVLSIVLAWSADGSRRESIAELQKIRAAVERANVLAEQAAKREPVTGLTPDNGVPKVPGTEEGEGIESLPEPSFGGRRKAPLFTIPRIAAATVPTRR